VTEHRESLPRSVLGGVGVHFLSRHTELIYAATRVEVFTLLGVAAVIETILGVLITIGLGTKWAAFIASGQMAAAYFLRQYPFAILPIFQPPGTLGESAVFNCFFFLYLAAQGAGVLSVDRLLATRRGRGAT